MIFSRTPPRLAGMMMLALAAVALSSGCLRHDPDPFFDDWKAKAEKAPPVLPQQQVIEASTPGKKDQTTLYDQARTLAPTDQSPPMEGLFNAADLPTEKISVRFVDMELATAIRTLASIAKQNILINPEVGGKEGKEAQNINLEVTDLPWNSVFMGIINNYGLTISKEGDLLRVMRQEDVVERKALQRKSEDSSHFVTRTVPINFINLVKPKSQRFTWSSTSKNSGGSTSGSSNADPVEDFLRTIQPMLSHPGKGSSISYDRHSSRVLIRETEENMDNVIKCIAELDRPTPQIQIKAHIVETTKDTARELGIKWGALSDNGVLGDPRVKITPGSSPASYVNGVLTYPAPNSTTLGQNIDLGATNIDDINPSTIGLVVNGSDLLLNAQLSALQKDGQLNILSSPSIATLDNSEAIISSGKEVPFQTVDADGKISIEYKDASLELMVIPHVVSNGFITLNIEAKKNEVDSANSVNGNPLIIKKMAKTQLIVENNATVVLAGLSRESNSGTNAGVPGLKEVPGLGWLFKKDSKSQEFEELLIFITPKILTAPESVKAAGIQP